MFSGKLGISSKHFLRVLYLFERQSFKEAWRGDDKEMEGRDKSNTPCVASPYKWL